jgi:formyl-CoA transferase
VPKLSATPGRIRSAAPKLGEHTDEILRELKFSDLEVDQLRRDKII